MKNKKNRETNPTGLWPISSVDRIIELAKLGRAVYFITDRKKKEITRIPAAFVQNYQARILVQQVWAGYYFEKRV